MLSWSLAFLVASLVAGVLGFSGLAKASSGIAKIVFGVFLVFLVLSLIGNVLS